MIHQLENSTVIVLRKIYIILAFSLALLVLIGEVMWKAAPRTWFQVFSYEVSMWKTAFMVNWTGKKPTIDDPDYQ